MESCEFLVLSRCFLISSTLFLIICLKLLTFFAKLLFGQHLGITNKTTTGSSGSAWRIFAARACSWRYFWYSYYRVLCWWVRSLCGCVRLLSVVGRLRWRGLVCSSRTIHNWCRARVWTGCRVRSINVGCSAVGWCRWVCCLILNRHCSIGCRSGCRWDDWDVSWRRGLGGAGARDGNVTHREHELPKATAVAQ